MQDLFDDLGHALVENRAAPYHLIIAEMAGSFEVVALQEQDNRQEGFPLPPDLYQGVIEIAEKRGLDVTWMQASFSMIVTPEKLPEDFFEAGETSRYREALTITQLSRSGQKYLALFAAVHRENDAALEALKALVLTSSELLQITRWVRTAGILEHKHGARLTEVLGALAI